MYLTDLENQKDSLVHINSSSYTSVNLHNFNKHMTNITGIMLPMLGC